MKWNLCSYPDSYPFAATLLGFILSPNSGDPMYVKATIEEDAAVAYVEALNQAAAPGMVWMCQSFHLLGHVDMQLLREWTMDNFEVNGPVIGHGCHRYSMLNALINSVILILYIYIFPMRIQLTGRLPITVGGSNQWVSRFFAEKTRLPGDSVMVRKSRTWGRLDQRWPSRMVKLREDFAWRVFLL